MRFQNSSAQILRWVWLERKFGPGILIVCDAIVLQQISEYSPRYYIVNLTVLKISLEAWFIKNEASPWGLIEESYE